MALNVETIRALNSIGDAAVARAIEKALSDPSVVAEPVPNAARITRAIKPRGVQQYCTQWDSSFPIDASAGKPQARTMHQVQVAEAEFDAVRIWFPNITADGANVEVTDLMVGASSRLDTQAVGATGYNPATGTFQAGTDGPGSLVQVSADGLWKIGTFDNGAANSKVLPAAVAPANKRPSWTASDWIQLSPVAPAANDAINKKALPILHVRAFFQNGGVSYQQYAPAHTAEWPEPDASLVGEGRIQMAFFPSQQGLAWNFATVANQTHASGLFNNLRGQWCVPEFRYVGRGIKVLGVGDSIMCHSVSEPGSSYAFKACARASTPEKPITFYNSGASGFNTATTGNSFINLARDAMTTFDPDVVIVPMGSPNDAVGSNAAADAQWFNCMNFVEEVVARGALPILVTMFPKQVVSGASEAADQFRKRSNDRTRALADRGFLVVDVDQLVTVPGQPWKWNEPLYHDPADNPALHPNEAGQDIVGNALAQVLQLVVAASV